MMSDVVADLLAQQRPQAGRRKGRLCGFGKRPLLDPLLHLRPPGDNDLQIVGRAAAPVGQCGQLRELMVRQLVALVDQQQGRPRPLRQALGECLQAAFPVSGDRFETELREQGREQVAGGGRVPQEGRMVPARMRVAQRPQQHRLAAAGVADKQDQPGPRRDRIGQCQECGAERRRFEDDARIRSDRKRLAVAMGRQPRQHVDPP